MGSGNVGVSMLFHDRHPSLSRHRGASLPTLHHCSHPRTGIASEQLAIPTARLLPFSLCTVGLCAAVLKRPPRLSTPQIHTPSNALSSRSAGRDQSMEGSGDIAASLMRTGQYTAACRAFESSKAVDERLFTDPFAEQFAEQYGRDFVAAVAASSPHTTEQLLSDFAAVRTRWFDDVLSLAECCDVAQVVVMGCGGDARAYRIDGDHRSFYNVDLEPVISHRRTVFADASTDHPVHEVAADCSNVAAVLLLLESQHGFDRTQPVLYLLEGLLMYIPTSGVDHLLKTLAEAAAPGSWLAADVVSQSHLSGDSTGPLRAVWDQWGSPVVSAMDWPEHTLPACGWTVERVTTYGEDDFNYGRVPEPMLAYFKANGRVVPSADQAVDSADPLPRNLSFLARK